jgi:thiazole synthase
MDLCGPARAPFQIRLAILPIGIRSVSDAEIVRRRSNDKVNTRRGDLAHAGHAILEPQVESCHEHKVAKNSIRTRISLLFQAMSDKPSKLKIADREFTSRLLVGTGKFASNELMRDALLASGTEIVTVALRRADLSGKHDPYANILDFIDPKKFLLLPNTSGARNADEAVRLARLAASAGLPKWIKLEIHPDPRYLLPDPVETLAAAEILIKEGFTVLPYINADPVLAKRLQDVGTATVMPLGSPIGSNRGIETRPQIEIIIEQATVPVVVDAGLGAPSQAAEAMEMGAAAVLVNTALAIATDPVRMARAFRKAIEAGREAHEIGLAEKQQTASATSPLTGYFSSHKVLD